MTLKSGDCTKEYTPLDWIDVELPFLVRTDP